MDSITKIKGIYFAITPIGQKLDGKTYTKPEEAGFARKYVDEDKDYKRRREENPDKDKDDKKKKRHSSKVARANGVDAKGDPKFHKDSTASEKQIFKQEHPDGNVKGRNMPACWDFHHPQGCARFNSQDGCRFFHSK